ncbi:MAG TPA: hypothetical protein VFE33_11145 [Thermoanaerobaculia bacterium]|nr:hypothetical protein [Thermoanaerobaculia bacterium]
MSTTGNTGNTETTPSVTSSGNPPANPAKGNQRGQTTLAAEINRWEALAESMAPQVDQTPGLKEAFEQFQALLAEAKSLRKQLNGLQASASTAMTRREQVLLDGGDLFSRLHHALQFVHGPRNPQLKEFGLKPLRTRKPRRATLPATTPTPPITPAPPPVEVGTGHAPAAEPVATAAKASLGT